MNAIVIGSGPSGLMAALSLAKDNIDVIIIDSNESIFPSKKVCAECEISGYCKRPMKFSKYQPQHGSH